MIVFGFNVYFQAPVAGGCVTSNTSLPHNEMLYGWQSGDDPTSWTGPASITNADAATFDTAYDTSVLTTGKPAGACDVGLRTTLTGTAGHETYQFDKGSIIAVGTNLDIKFYIYVQTPISVVANATILSAGQNTVPTSGLSFGINLRNNAGTNEVRASSTTNSAYLALIANSWNLVHIHVDVINTSSTIAINGGTATGFQSSATIGVRYIYVGACSAGAGAVGEWVTDLIAVNTP